MAAAEYFRKGDLKKEAVNEWLVRVVDSHCTTTNPPSSPPFALILEAEDMVTLKHLEKYRNDPNLNLQCVVPNPSKHVSGLISETKGVHTFEVTSHQLLDDIESNGQMRQSLNASGFNSFDIVWLDYCGNFESKPGRRRQRDIRILFGHNSTDSRGFLSGKSVLALTFSSRGSASFYEHETVEKVISFMKEVVDDSKRFTVEFVGVASYSADTSSSSLESKKAQAKKKQRVQSLSIYTLVFKVNGVDNDVDARLDSQLDSIVKCPLHPQPAPVSVEPPVPHQVEGLVFFRDWCALRHMGEKSKLLKALEQVASDFMKLVIITSNGGGTAIIMDSRLATISSALLTGWKGKIMTFLPKHSNKDLVFDIMSKQYMLNQSKNNIAQSVESSQSSDEDNNHFLDTLTVVEKPMQFKDVIPLKENADNLQVVYLDYGEQSPFTASALRNCDDWSDLNALLSTCISFNLFEKFEFITVGILINVSPGNLYWEHLEIDWLVSGMQQAALRYNPRLKLRVKLVHKFVAPIPRVALTFQLGFFPDLVDEETQASEYVSCLLHHSAQSSSSVNSKNSIDCNFDAHVDTDFGAVDVSGWFSHRGSWPRNRLKIPGNSSKRFQHVVDKVMSLLSRSGATLCPEGDNRVFLHEPGAFHVLNAIFQKSLTALKKGKVSHSKICLSNEYENIVERDEVEQRICQLKEQWEQTKGEEIEMSHTKKDNEEFLSNHPPSSEVFVSSSLCDIVGKGYNALILLTDLSIIAWEAKWFQHVVDWFEKNASSVHTVNAPLLDRAEERKINEFVVQNTTMDESLESKSKPLAQDASGSDKSKDNADDKQCSRKLSLALMVENSDKVEKIHAMVSKLKAKVGAVSSNKTYHESSLLTTSDKEQVMPEVEIQVESISSVPSSSATSISHMSNNNDDDAKWNQEHLLSSDSHEDDSNTAITFSNHGWIVTREELYAFTSMSLKYTLLSLEFEYPRNDR